MARSCAAALLSLLAGTAFAGVELNTASQAELEAVRGIGTVTSALILEERGKGAFRDWPDFAARVPGVGGRNAAKLSAAGITVNGAALKATK